MEISSVIQLFLIGISQGCGYALVAIGFVFIYRSTEIINFAHGELMMLGAFLILTFSQIPGMSFWLAAILGIASMGLIGFLIDVVVMRRVIGEPQASIFILTVAIGFILKSVAGMIWGWEPLSLATPFTGNLDIAGISIGLDRVTVVIGTVALCVILYLFFNKTVHGLAIQASSQNQLAAYYSRIPVKKLISLVWVIAAMTAAFAGMMMAPLTQVDTQMGMFGIKAFAGAVVGGFGSIPGALLGCLIIGISEPFLDYAFPPLKGVYAYIIMLGVLLIKPEGLISQTFSKKV
ncbi:MAG: branched-chain amino acid ABC transporter permease [Deltaproteobacteria bacterium]